MKKIKDFMNKLFGDNPNLISIEELENNLLKEFNIFNEEIGVLIDEDRLLLHFRLSTKGHMLYHQYTNTCSFDLVDLKDPMNMLILQMQLQSDEKEGNITMEEMKKIVNEAIKNGDIEDLNKYK